MILSLPKETAILDYGLAIVGFPYFEVQGVEDPFAD